MPFVGKLQKLLKLW